VAAIRKHTLISVEHDGGRATKKAAQARLFENLRRMARISANRTR
jgi:hypothetical protein